MTSRKIISLDNQVSKEPSLNPKTSFICYMCASRGSGKTVTLINMLINKELLGEKFNQIYIISPTNKLDAKWDLLKNTNTLLINHKLINKLKKEKQKNKLFETFKETSSNYSTKIPDENFIEDVNVDLLKSLIEEQKKIITEYGKEFADEILIVYDDCISAKKFFSSESVQKLIFNSRHFKISLIITSQSYKSLPKCLRLNVSLMILYYTANKKELETIYEENSSSLGFKAFEKIFQDITNVPFNFLCINYQNDSKHRLQNAFENFI